ncbi:methyl-accepting chemotaxis protein [Roseateles sp. P5_D6]
MRPWHRWFASLVGRIWLGMGGLLVLMLVIAGIGLVQSQAVETQLLSAQAEAQRLTAAGRRMHDRVTDAYLATLLATMVDDPEDLKFELNSLAKAMAAYDEQFKEVFDQPSAEALAQRADELRRAETELAPLLASSVKRLQRAAEDAGAGYQHDSAIQELVVSSLKPLFDQWLRAIDALDTTAAEASEAASAEASAAARLGRWAQAGIVAVGLAIGLIAAFGVARSLTAPVRAAVAVASRVAEGDLGQAVPPGGQDEIGQLLRSLGDMQGGLHRLVASARDAAEQIDVSAGEVASGISDLSHRTELAAAELQRTAAATTQLSAGVRALAESAGSAGAVTHGATQAALAGNNSMGQAQQLMGAIGRSSERIASIVGVIDNIAFRTNILALNAAVEAAGAGEHGRGFAVVAGEVRLLSKGVADAARDIRRLVESSADEVKAGQALVLQAGGAMQETVAAVQRLTDFLGGIAAAMPGQASQVAAVDSAVQALEQVTQQNAALVEQGAASAVALGDQAHRLKSLVAVFRLQEEEGS